MKVAIYIEAGVTQLVLTPETDWERAVTDKLVPSGTISVAAYRGEFYDCRGGWIRHGSQNSSVILRLDEHTDPPSPPERDHVFPVGGVFP